YWLSHSEIVDIEKVAVHSSLRVLNIKCALIESRANEDQTMALQPPSSGVKIQDLSSSIIKDKYMMKAQVHVSKSSVISDIQALPRRKYFLLSSGKESVEGEIVSKLSRSRA
nr:hypothetical protein [Tanacetum cinerariifolium]